ncbi:uncharacterized protein [Littorina saxatilis]|uniref:uncharacterized protein n=1 Tax=Littorina saxatilis TaxID=31220 RepID=UPI0038B48803
MKHLQLLVLLCIVDCARAVDPPMLTVDPTGVVLEETAPQTKLMEITCTPSSGANPMPSVNLARVTPSFPCTGCFAVLPCSAGFCLNYLAGQGTLNVRLASRYQVTYSCTDSEGRYASKTADVFIKPNAPPYFTGLKGWLLC